MAKHVIYGAFGLLAAVVIAAAIYFDKPASAPVVNTSSEVSEDLGASVAIAGESEEGSQEPYEVSKVIDGDTIVVRMAGKQETVRFIGIDAPETGVNAECFAAEATNALKSLLAGRPVRLEVDPTQGERDKYDRLLAYVFTETGVNAAKKLIENGFAKEYTYSKSYKYQKEFKAAQKSAQKAKEGMWAPDACAKPAPTPSVTQKTADQLKVQPKTEPESKINEEPVAEPEKPAQKEPEPEVSRASVDTSSYTCSTNTYNCSDFTTHAEAQAVFEQCGGASNDVHKLDANKDGEACETLP